MKALLVTLLATVGVSVAFMSIPGRSLTSPRDVFRSDTTSTSHDGDRPQPATTIVFRPAIAQEEGQIRRTLAAMLMNPLAIDVRNFTCADDEGVLVGFGQIRSIGGADFELASLHVSPSHRGRGIGSDLVRRLVERFVAEHGNQELRRLHLLTLADTARFYQKLGFDVISPDDAPAVLSAEMAVGSFIQSFFGNSLVCMRAVSM